MSVKRERPERENYFPQSGKTFFEKFSHVGKSIKKVMHRGRFVSINGSFFGTLFDTYLKNQVFRSIGVEEVLRRILGKAIMTTLVDSVGLLQVRADH